MPRMQARNRTMNRQRESGAHEFSRIERWLNEIGDSERSALPIDFSETVEALSHPHPQPQQHEHEHEHQHHPQVKYFDYRDSSSSDTSESSKVTATESETDLKQSDSSSLSPASLNSNKLKIFREAHKQQQQQQNIPGGCGDNKVSGTSDQHHQQQQQQQSLHQPQPPLQDSVKQSKALPPQNGVTCRFHLCRRRSPSSASKLSSTISSSSTSSSTSESACRNSRRQRRRRQLNLLRSLTAEDPALVRISAHRGVSISLGDVTDDRRRAVAVSGASWRAVMSAVGDLSHAVPGLMSPADVNSSVSTPLEVAKAAAQAESEVSERRPQKRAKVAHDRGLAQAAVPPLQMKSTVRYRSLENQSGQHRSQQDQPGQHRSQQDQPGQHRSQQDQSGQHRSQQDLSGQHRSQRDQSGQHRSQQDQPVQHRKHQQRQHQPEQPVSSKSNDYKLAQNVRFQLITPQRESMFEQDSTTGRPVHPRLRSLLASMGMDMIFLERSVGPKNVPSVKVRFLLNKFEQLTAFCNAIDYQLPRQSSV